MKHYLVLMKSNNDSKNFTNCVELAEVLDVDLMNAELMILSVDSIGKFENNEIIIVEDLAQHEKVNTYR